VIPTPDQQEHDRLEKTKSPEYSNFKIFLGANKPTENISFEGKKEEDDVIRQKTG